MPRAPRIKGDDIHYHIILRCNNKEHLFQREEDFEIFLEILAGVKEKFAFKLYNYELLHSHIHLLLSTHTGYFIDQVMHELCLKYAKDFNQRHNRIGHFWAHRYRSSIIADDRYALACIRYQHRNTLSAGMVARPEDWVWSGYTYYAFGTPNDLLEFHPSYLGLVNDDEKRKRIYRELVMTPLPSDKTHNLLEESKTTTSRRVLAMVNQVNGLAKRIKGVL